MSEDCTLYRGEGGTPHLLAFRCAHRGTQLSTGWVEGENIRCFYHGWTYDPSGQCIEQPAEPDPFCERIRIRAYPTQEYLGVIFAYLGEGQAPELPRYPDFESAQPEDVNTYVRRCNYFNNFDNDSLHTYFVHARPSHNWRQWGGAIPTVVAEEDQFGQVHWTCWPDGRTSSPNHRGMPNIVLRKAPRTSTPSPRAEDSLEWRVPIDDETHLMVMVEVPHHREERPRPTASPNWWPPTELATEILSGRLGREHIDIFRTDIFTVEDAVAEYADGRMTDIVKAQDGVAQIGQGVVADRDAEHLGQSDASIIHYRSLWLRELQALLDGRPLKPWYRTEEQVKGL
jgi:5,5'-dehydrodivanillate O-demethylase